MANASVIQTSSAEASSHHTGGVNVELRDGSVRFVSPTPPAGPVPIPYPNVAATTSDAKGVSGDYLFTSVSHTARDNTYGQPASEGDLLFGGEEAAEARYFNGFVSRFSAGDSDDAYRGAHVLYQDVVIPTGQAHDGTSNTVFFAEVVIRPASAGFDGLFA